MAHAALAPSTVLDRTKVNALLDAVDRAATVDDGFTVLGAAAALQPVASGSITFRTIPIVNPSLRTPNDGDAVQVDPEAVQTFIADGGESADATTTAPATSGSASGRSGSAASSSATAPSDSSSTATAAADPSTAAVPCVN